MPYFTEFLTVAFVHLLAVMSPGPDFAMITRNSLVYSKRTGIYSALGLSFGILVHITYSLVGIGFIIAKSIVLFSIIKFLGAAYLIYIGYKSLRAKSHKEQTKHFAKKDDISKSSAVLAGFLTNVLNPKATLFFLALFTQVIHQSTPTGIKILYGIEMTTVQFLWFALVALFFSNRVIKTKISTVHHYVEKGIGIVLIALGFKVALSTAK